jgi:tyrosine-protein kinase Etk/Wzc
MELRRAKIISVTSSKGGIGKTIFITNLAGIYQTLGKKVLLIDCDLRKGRLHRVFDLVNVYGLSNCLIDETDDNKLMDISISDLNLSTRAYNVLNAKYKNLYELSHITIEDLLEMRELGVVSIKEIIDKLYENGIYIEHNTLKNIKTGKVRYTSKYDNTVYKIWKLI